MSGRQECREGGTDQGAGARSAKPTGQQLRDRLHKSYANVVKSLNLSELNLLFVQEKLLSAQEAHRNATHPESLIMKIEGIGESGYEKLYTCISKESKHLGHRYVQAVLEDKAYATEEEVKVSEIIGVKVQEHLPTLACSDVKALLTPMYSKELLTLSEYRHLDNEAYDTSKLLLHVIVLLDTKGPLAYSLFAECLHSIDPATYAQVFEAVKLNVSSSRQPKRRRETGLSVCQAPLAKHDLPKLKLHGCLRGSKYNKIMRVFQECHHNGEWSTLEVEASKLQTAGTPTELHVVALLERAVSWVFRRQEEKVLGFVDRAKELCAKVDGDNATFLTGRCEYILSRLYRYLQQYDKAQEHVQKATYILHMAEPGEDSAFAHYCDACIQVERLSKNPGATELHRVKWSYEYAIAHARSHDSGLDLVAPHSFMRLAQMYLGSSHYTAGSQTDRDSIATASSCLGEVDPSALARRSKCHYLLIQSDLQRCQQSIQESKITAQHALDMAQTYNFTLEITSAKKRLNSF